MRAFAVQHATLRIPSHHIMLASQPGKGDLLSLDEPIKKMYADIRDRGDHMQHLVWEQERTIIALKVFLEDKIEKFQQRHVERSQPPSDRPRYAKDWPTATIPLSQLATVLLSSMLAYLVESTNLPAGSSDPQDPTPSTEPVMVMKGKAPAIPSPPQLLEHHSGPNSPVEESATPVTVIGPSEICQPSPSSSLPRSVSPEIFTSSSPAPHVKFYLPKLLKERRDSAISLLSSTGHPEKLDIQDDETLPDSGSSECEEDQVMSEPDDTTEIEDGSGRAIGTEEAVQDEQSLEQATTEDSAEPQVPGIDEKGKGPAIIESNVENEVVVDSYTNPHPDHNSAKEDEVMFELDATTEIKDCNGRAIGTEEAIEDKQSLGQATVEDSAESQAPGNDEKGKGPAIIDSSVENEVVVDSHTNPNPDHNSTEEDLYSADDAPTLTRLEPIPIPEEHNLEGDADPDTRSTTRQASPNADITASYATPFLSTNWPQRAWLQTVLSMLTPVIEARPTSPVSPSFDPEQLTAPPADPPSSEWYSRYDAWWSFTMRGGSGQREDDDGESTITSTSHHSWGAGSRSTDADSIDS
ncbi:hypothetical protein BDZ45DRAFT_393483 [Acephala macrosclerotiorum]|nr:hypothetical protein BDZ45DRAFT_393483 [Acephala macrosclerotiorum]